MLYSHIMVGADDIAAAKKFYDAALGAIGLDAGAEVMPGARVIYQKDGSIFAVTKPFNGEAATFANGGTIGFNAPSTEAVVAFYQAGQEAGGTCDGPPGPRDAIPGSYAAYLRDPTGNKILAWCMQTQ